MLVWTSLGYGIVRNDTYVQALPYGFTLCDLSYESVFIQPSGCRDAFA